VWMGQLGRYDFSRLLLKCNRYDFTRLNTGKIGRVGHLSLELHGLAFSLAHKALELFRCQGVAPISFTNLAFGLP
jgi:hypothetical protein